MYTVQTKRPRQMTRTAFSGIVQAANVTTLLFILVRPSSPFASSTLTIPVRTQRMTNNLDGHRQEVTRNCGELFNKWQCVFVYVCLWGLLLREIARFMRLSLTRTFDWGHQCRRTHTPSGQGVDQLFIANWLFSWPTGNNQIKFDNA
jgi:hypothetical protein